MPHHPASGAVVLDTPSDFHRNWPSWVPGAPFPLLAGPAVDRYRDRLGAVGVEHLPAVWEHPRDGVVISVGADGHAAARLLSVATSRPAHQVALQDLADEIARHADDLVAVVGLADDLAGCVDWPGMLAPRVGVVTARDLSALVCLVYRTLTVHEIPRTRDFVLAHPTDIEASGADAVSFAELDPLLSTGLRALVYRTHAAECSAILPDALICGRSDPVGTPLPLITDERRSPTCLRGGGCFRQDLSDEQRLRATDIDAHVVFAEGCSSVALGNNQMTPDVNIGIGFLSGSAVAFLGAVGSYIGHPQPRRDFEIGLDKGMPLGDVLETVNERAHGAVGDLSHFGLLGDPALTLPDAATNRSGHGRRERGAGPLGYPSLTDPLVEQVAFWHSTVVPRLSRLRWLGLPVDDDLLSRLRHDVGQLVDTWSAGGAIGAAAKDLVDQMGAVQAAMVASAVRLVHSSWWDFTGDRILNLRQVSAEPYTCPACLADRAVLLQYQHRVESDLTVRTVQCRRCYDVWWSTGDQPDVPTAGDMEYFMRRGTVGRFSRELVNSTLDELVGAVGFALVAGDQKGMAEGWSEPRRVEPMSRQHVEFTVDVTSPEVGLKDYEAVVLTLFNGVYSATELQVCVFGER